MVSNQRIEAVDSGREFSAALQTAVQALAAAAQCLQQLAQSEQFPPQRLEGLLKGRIGRDFGPGATALLKAEGQSQLSGGEFQPVGLCKQFRHIARLLVIRHHAVPGQIQQLPATQAQSEEVARHLRQLVGLIQDKTVRQRQQFTEALLFEGHVGAQQMVVDHHQIRLLSPPTRFHQVTLVVVGALLSQTVFGTGGHQRPDGGILRDPRHLGDIAGAGAAGPAANVLQLLTLFSGQAKPFRQGLREPMAAQIIGPALEQGHGNRPGQCLAYQRQIPVKQLILQVLGAGGDDHLAPGQQGRHQIGEGLAGTGAGLAYQHPTLLQNAGDRLRHLELLGALGVAGNMPGEQTVLSEDLAQFEHVGLCIRQSA